MVYVLKKRRRKTLIKLIIKYFHFRKSFFFGYQKYLFWRRMIEYTTEVKDQKILRSLFSTLIANDILQKKKTGKEVSYLFNPKNMFDENKLYENRFIVKF